MRRSDYDYDFEDDERRDILQDLGDDFDDDECICNGGRGPEDPWHGPFYWVSSRCPVHKDC